MNNTGTVCCVCRGGANIFKEDNWYCYACWFSSEKESPSQEHNCKYKELADRFEKILYKLSSSAAQRFWAELKQELDL